MHRIDMASLLREELTHGGCNDEQDDTFDGYSTIEQSCDFVRQ
jgi:hypothetical protein